MPITKEQVKQKSQELLADLQILQEISLTRLMPLQQNNNQEKLQNDLELDITLTNNLQLELQHFIDTIDHEN
jgi:hypothetical protein